MKAFLLAICLTLASSSALAVAPDSDIDTLIEAVKHRDPSIRASACEALRVLGPEAEKAIPALMEAIKIKDPREKIEGIQRSEQAAIAALSAIGQAAIPKLIETLEHGDEPAGPRAGFALAKIKPIPQQFATGLIEILNDAKAEDWRRKGAASALANIPTATKESVAALRKLINVDLDEELAESGMAALGKIGGDSEPAVPDLVALLQIEEPIKKTGPSGGGKLHRLKHMAVSILGEIGPSAKAAVPTLIKIEKDKIDDSRSDVAMSAIDALGRIGPDAKSAVPTLIPLLGDANEFTRRRVAVALGGIGPDAKQAIPELEKAIKVGRLTQGQVEPLEQALRRITGHSGQPMPIPAAELPIVVAGPPLSDLDLYIEALNHSDAYIRVAARTKLLELGPKAEKAIPALIQALKDQGRAGFGNKTVGDTLAAIGPAAITSLFDAFEHGEKPTAEPAGEALIKIDPLPEKLAPRLIELAHDTTAPAWRRAEATAMLGNIPGAAKDAIPLLKDFLNADTDQVLVQAALDAIVKLGAAEETMPDLIKLLKMETPPGAKLAGGLRAGGQSKIPPTPRMAILALGQLGPKAKDAVPELIEFAKRRNSPDRPNSLEIYPVAIEALGKIGPAAKDAVPVIAMALTDEKSANRKVAAEALGRIGPAAKAAVPALEKALRLDQMAGYNNIEKSMEEALRAIKAGDDKPNDNAKPSSANGAP